MNLQQLTCLCAVVKNRFSVSEAARRLGVSQPAVSKQNRALEAEVGVDLLQRSRHRIVGLTAPGEAVYHQAVRTLREAENISRSIEEFSDTHREKLTIATTSTYASFLLPPVIRSFMLTHGNIELVLRQGTPSSILQWMLTGEADIAVSNRPPHAGDELEFIRCGELVRCIIAPKDHALLQVDHLTLKVIAKYPIATLDESFEGGRVVRQAFDAARLRPNIVLNGLDPGVVKTYVGIGMCVAILPSIAFDPETDVGMAARDAASLFPGTMTYVQLRKGQYMSKALRHFINLLAPGAALPS